MFQAAVGDGKGITRELYGLAFRNGAVTHAMIRNGLLGLMLLGSLSGCATSSLFHPYPSQAREWKRALGRSPAGSVTDLKKGTDGRDAVLYLQELGRVDQVDGRYAASKKAFARAIDDYHNTDAQARIRLSGLAADSGSLLVNDNIRPYVAPAYERIFTHTYQALNYWQESDASDTAVELRAAANEQRYAADQHEEELAKADQAIQDHHIDTARYSGYFEGLDAAAGRVEASFQNAWTFYLSALFWEAHGDYNDALVDYKKALQIHPHLDLIKADVQRVSQEMNGAHPWHGKGMVAVLFEQGYVPPRRAIALPIPTTQGIVSVAFPTYDAADKPDPYPLRVRGDGEQADTRVLADVGGMAAKSLREQAPAMLVRQTLRTVTKYNLQKKANDDFGPLGAFLTQLFNLVSEQADLRSWLSLPAYGQATRLLLPPGKQRLVLSTPGGSATLTVPVVERGLTVIHVMAPPGRLITRVLPVQEGPL